MGRKIFIEAVKKGMYPHNTSKQYSMSACIVIRRDTSTFETCNHCKLRKECHALLCDEQGIIYQKGG